MNDYTFRPWQGGDDLALLQIWHNADNTQSQAFRSAFTVDSDSAPWSRTIVAEHQGIPVAAGTVYETSLHNRHLWSYVEVAPEHRRNGVGSELLKQLQELAQSSPSGVSTLRTKVEKGSAGYDFATEHGLSPIQRSRMVRVHPGTVPLVPLREDEDGRPTQEIEDIATGSVELTRVLWDFYQKAHEWDPPAEIDLPRVNRLFLSDEAEAYGAVVLRDDVLTAKKEGKKAPIKAFAVSYRPLEADMPGFEMPEDAATEVLIGYDFEYPGAREAIMQLLSLLAHQYPVILEVDDSMEDLTVMIDHLIKSGVAEVEEETIVLVQA